MGRKRRLDSLLVDRGLAPSRERAKALILAGAVEAGSRRDLKPGTTIESDTPIQILSDPVPYVGRGGVKLAHVLRKLELDLTGCVCLDVGASTGGFTDCLLKFGASSVFAVDVGRGLLDWGMRNDPRVTVLEGLNARNLCAENLPSRPDLSVIDVSFISLRLILPPVASLLKPEGWIVSLVKPQFEVGKGEVGKGGIVRSASKHVSVLLGLVEFCMTIGFTAIEVIVSPITGAKGNVEYFLLIKPGDAQNRVTLEKVEAVVSKAMDKD